jgi:hypothetical protein
LCAENSIATKSYLYRLQFLSLHSLTAFNKNKYKVPFYSLDISPPTLVRKNRMSDFLTTGMEEANQNCGSTQSIPLTTGFIVGDVYKMSLARRKSENFAS